ncbi:uroporphyrinogen decarboxylase [Veillonella caviae]|uniref:uroporphyrinogen decarboxylase n=1 Tax=Veillonella caviae TaxID=248316 RepID=UPI0023A848C6|nr:uroporphyrinogen decarboxylase [Veillonella caviae]MCI5709372.1 uroporphyrinogen decarboxylase [Veillonella caviae]MDY5714462.1 uroporphyrinogen decarboxylase [Veillonella caviae]
MNTAYLDMIRGKQPGVTPVWYMRQAGRSQAAYRKIKEKYTLFEITKQPELCAQVTELPVKEYGVDAAILYKDIMSPMVSIGVNVDIKPGVGPVFDTPIQRLSDVERLHAFDPTKVEYIAKTIQLLTTEVLKVPLIGFCGAPFTVASYLIEGGPTKNYNKTRGLMVSEPHVWHALMEKLATMSIEYLSMQAESGANALQIFDSWVGAVNRNQYDIFIFPHMERIISTVKARFPTVPLAMNGVGTDHLITSWAKLPLDVVALDWRSSLRDAASRGVTQTVQGNLDPAYLLADTKTISAQVDTILMDGVHHGKHIFNLGHGVFPEVDPEKLHWLTDYVHDKSRELWAREGTADE